MRKNNPFFRDAQCRYVATGAAKGFTLIELVVALAIFAVMATLMYSFLDGVLKAKEGQTRAGDELARLQKALILMQRDVEQAIDRPVRDTFGDSQAPVIVSNGQGFELTRLGWSMPPFTRSQRSEVQRVRYEYTDNEIVRTHWVTPDITGDESDRNPVVTPIMTDIETFEVRVAQVNPDSGEVSWQTDWPSQQAQGFDPQGNPIAGPALPSMLEMSIEHKRFGALRRVFRIVGIGAEHATLPDRPDDQGNNGNGNNNNNQNNNNDPNSVNGNNNDDGGSVPPDNQNDIDEDEQ